MASFLTAGVVVAVQEEGQQEKEHCNIDININYKQIPRTIHMQGKICTIFLYFLHSTCFTTLVYILGSEVCYDARRKSTQEFSKVDSSTVKKY